MYVLTDAASNGQLLPPLRRMLWQDERERLTYRTYHGPPPRQGKSNG